MKSLRIGIDTGGTFTDFVVIRDGGIEVFKELSTPQNPEEAILKGIARIAIQDVKEIIHGSTVATNALLERKGARTALLTTEGFEDVVVIGRQTRPDLYDIFVNRPESLVKDDMRLGVRERTLYDGSIEIPLDRNHLRGLVQRITENGIQSVAVSLLFSFANSKHELEVRRELQGIGVPISLSSSVLPEHREYERTSTTLINAYLAPLMNRYLASLRDRLSHVPLRVMQSNGGAVTANAIAAAPVHSLLSGPAGGVVGAFHLARMCEFPKIITFDMGGTSTDVALCEEDVKVSHENVVDGMPVGIPMIDIHTVGAGGGSIAQLDMGGALKVGPQSAGAEPGPICYGRGSQFTVTDANVLLGRLLPQFFLGGAMRLHNDRVGPAIRQLHWTKAWKRPEDLAQGVIDIVNNNMEQAIRLISVERGYDPRDFALFCFGGAGGIHAASLARALGIRQIIVPRHPGALSALGLLLADARKDFSKSLLIEGAGSAASLEKTFNELHSRGKMELKAEGFKTSEIRSVDFVDLRYRGQSYELTIPFTSKFIAAFHDAHEWRYGYSNREKGVELVNARTTFFGRTPKPKFEKAPRQRGRPKPIHMRTVWIDGRRIKTAVYDRAFLGYGHAIDGPAIIGEYSSTTLVPPDFGCHVDPYLNLILQT